MNPLQGAVRVVTDTANAATAAAGAVGGAAALLIRQLSQHSNGQIPGVIIELEMVTTPETVTTPRRVTMRIAVRRSQLPASFATPPPSVSMIRRFNSCEMGLSRRFRRVASSASAEFNCVC